MPAGVSTYKWNLKSTMIYSAIKLKNWPSSKDYQWYMAVIGVFLKKYWMTHKRIIYVYT